MNRKVKPTYQFFQIHMLLVRTWTILIFCAWPFVCVSRIFLYVFFSISYIFSLKMSPLNPPGRRTNWLIIVSMHRNLDIYLIIVV